MLSTLNKKTHIILTTIETESSAGNLPEVLQNYWLEIGMGT